MRVMRVPGWTLIASFVALAPLVASADASISFHRSESRVATKGLLQEIAPWTPGQYVCGNNRPVCGRFHRRVMSIHYQEAVPAMNIKSAQGLGEGSLGWTADAFNYQQNYCRVFSFTDNLVHMGNSIHLVAMTRDDWIEYPVNRSDARCAYVVEGIPTNGILQRTGVNGLFGINPDGNLTRKYWFVNQWFTQVIPTWGGKPLVGSLIQAEGAGNSTNVYGVNDNGQVFTTWVSANNTIEFAPIGVSGGLTPEVVLSNGNGVFGVTQSGNLGRTYHASGSWQFQTIAAWGGKVIPGSLIAGELTGSNANVYGINENGQVVTTYVSGGVINFAPISVSQGVLPNSLVLTDHGVYGVIQAGHLGRTYYEAGSWHFQTIPTWGGKVIPGSLIKGEFTGANANVYGVNENGQVVTTYRESGGGIGFAPISVSQDVAPNSLVLTDNGVFGVTKTGALVRTYYEAGSWQFQTIATPAVKIVQESLIKGELTGSNANVYGINENGQAFTTKKVGATITYTLIP